MFTRRPIGSTSASLSGSWESLGVTSGSRPSLAPAFRGSVAVAWRVSGGTDIRIRLYTPSTSSFGPPVTFEGPAEGDPQLVWDGTALNLFFVSSSGHRLRQVYASGPDLAFRDQVDVAPTAVSPSLFHAIPWNGRLHVVYVPEGGTGIQYTASQSPFGSLADLGRADCRRACQYDRAQACGRLGHPLRGRRLRGQGEVRPPRRNRPRAGGDGQPRWRDLAHSRPTGRPACDRHVLGRPRPAQLERGRLPRRQRLRQRRARVKAAARQPQPRRLQAADHAAVEHQAPLGRTRRRQPHHELRRRTRFSSPRRTTSRCSATSTTTARAT